MNKKAQRWYQQKQEQFIQGLKTSQMLTLNDVNQLLDYTKKSMRFILNPGDSLVLRTIKTILNVLEGIDVLTTEVLPSIYETKAIGQESLQACELSASSMAKFFEADFLSTTSVASLVVSGGAFLLAQLHAIRLLAHGGKTWFTIAAKIPQLDQLKHDILQLMFYLEQVQINFTHHISADQSNFILDVKEFEGWAKTKIKKMIKTLQYLAVGATPEEKQTLAEANAVLKFAIEKIDENVKQKDTDEKKEEVKQFFLSQQTRDRVDRLIEFEKQQNISSDVRVKFLEKGKKIILYLECVGDLLEKLKKPNINVLAYFVSLLNHLGYLIKEIESIDYKNTAIAEFEQWLNLFLVAARPLLISTTQLIEADSIRLGLVSEELNIKFSNILVQYDVLCKTRQKPELMLHLCWRERLVFRYNEKNSLESSLGELLRIKKIIKQFNFNPSISLYQLCQLRKTVFKLRHSVPLVNYFIENIDYLVRKRTGLTRLQYEIEQLENRILQHVETPDEAEILRLKKLYKTARFLRNRIMQASESEIEDAFSYQGDPLYVITEFLSYPKIKAFEATRVIFLEHVDFKIASVHQSIERLEQNIAEAEHAVAELPESNASWILHKFAMEMPKPSVEIPPWAPIYDTTKTAEALIADLQAERKASLALQCREAQQQLLASSEEWLDPVMLESMRANDKDAKDHWLIRAEDPLLFRSLKSVLNALLEIEIIFNDIEKMWRDKKIYLDMVLGEGFSNTLGKLQVVQAFLYIYKDRLSHVTKAIEDAYRELRALIDRAGLFVPKEMIEVLQSRLTLSASLIENPPEILDVTKHIKMNQEKTTVSTVLYDFAQMIKPTEADPDTDAIRARKISHELLERLSKLSDLLVKYSEANAFDSIPIITKLASVGFELRKTKNEGMSFSESAINKAIKDILIIIAPMVQVAMTSARQMPDLLGLKDKNIFLENIQPLMDLFNALFDLFEIESHEPALESELNARLSLNDIAQYAEEKSIEVPEEKKEKPTVFNLFNDFFAKTFAVREKDSTHTVANLM